MPPTISSSTAPSRNKRRQLIKQTQIQNKSIVSSIKKAAAQSQNVETGYTVGECSPVQTFLSIIFHQITRGRKRPWQSEKLRDYVKVIQIKTCKKHYSIIYSNR